MEYNFYVEKPIDRDELHQSIIDILKELTNKTQIDVADDIISCYPLQLFIYGSEYGADPVKEARDCGGCVALAWDIPESIYKWKRENPEIVKAFNNLKI